MMGDARCPKCLRSLGECPGHPTVADSEPSRHYSDGSSLIERAIDALERQLVCPFCEGTGCIVTWNYVPNPPHGYVARRAFEPCPYCARFRVQRLNGGGPT